MSGPLGVTAFRRLWTARTVSLLGSAIAPIAAVFAVLHVDSSAGAVGLVLAARALPQVLLLPLGGVVADRLPRVKVVVTAELVAAAVQIVAAVVVLNGSATVWQLMTLEAAQGAAAAFFFPAMTGLVPQTIPAALQQKANALLGLSQSGSFVFGAALGGIIVAAVGPGWGLALDAASFLVSATAAAGVRVSHSSTASTASTASAGFVRELAEGWQEFRSRTWLWAIVAQFTILVALGTTAEQTLGPLIAKRELGGAGAWGVLSALLAGGGLLGGLLALRWPITWRPLVVATGGIALTALPLAGLLVPLALPGLGVLFVLAGFGTAVFDVLWVGALQAHVPARSLSRVSAFDLLGSIGLSPVGYAVMGPLVHVIGIRGTLVVGIAGVLVPSLLVLLVKDVWRLPAGPVSAERPARPRPALAGPRPVPAERHPDPAGLRRPRNRRWHS